MTPEKPVEYQTGPHEVDLLKVLKTIRDRRRETGQILRKGSPLPLTTGREEISGDETQKLEHSTTPVSQKIGEELPPDLQDLVLSARAKGISVRYAQNKTGMWFAQIGHRTIALENATAPLESAGMRKIEVTNHGEQCFFSGDAAMLREEREKFLRQPPSRQEWTDMAITVGGFEVLAKYLQIPSLGFILVTPDNRPLECPPTLLERALDALFEKFGKTKMKTRKFILPKDSPRFEERFAAPLVNKIACLRCREPDFVLIIDNNGGSIVEGSESTTMNFYPVRLMGNGSDKQIFSE